MDIQDITLEHIEQLEQNPAWRLFVEEQKATLESYQAALGNPDSTEDLLKIRIIQGRIMSLSELIEWSQITREDIEENSKIKQEIEEQTNDE